MGIVKSVLSIALASVVTTALAGTHEVESAAEVVLASDVKWGLLNSARGDQSPRAGSLWGDRTGPDASGFLVQFADGFSSPPHIHNVTYRGVVIRGHIHNDDPAARNMWLPAGSFWIQPAGEAHITAADGRHNMAYIEIERGPYLVRPVEEAFDNAERPVNVDKSNLVWLGASDIVWVDQPRSAQSAKGAKIAFLWGSPQGGQLSGALVKLPAGFSGKIHSHGPSFRAVVIQGQLKYQMHDQPGVKSLEPGSYFGSKGSAVHQVSSKSQEDTIVYIRTKGKLEISPD